MTEQVKAAAVEGLLFGVKWGIALLVIGLLNVAWMGDYGVVRERATNGQRAFEHLLQQSQQAQKQAAPSAQPPLR